jgi:F-type H+-transporting ATPase subunit b
MGEFFEAFRVDWGPLAFQVANFLILLYLLNRFLFKPVLARLDERNQKIGKGLEDAESAARDRELARAEREAAVSEARKEAQEMVARANKIADDTRKEILDTARAEAEKVTARAREEITAEKERAMAELRGQVADLALLAAGRLVGERMDAATQRRLVEEFLAEQSGDSGDSGRRRKSARTKAKAN